MTIPTDFNELVVTAVMPAYNEEATIEAALRRLREAPLRIGTVCVHNASQDRTAGD